MAYLLGKIITCLLLAGMLGGLIGWLLKRIFAARRHAELIDLFKNEYNKYDEELQRVKNNWHSKYSVLDTEKNRIQALLDTRQQDNIVLAQSIKISGQQRNEQKRQLEALQTENEKIKALNIELQSINGDLKRQLNELQHENQPIPEQ